MQVMKVELNKMQETMLAEFKSELDDRRVGGAAFLNRRMLMEKLDKVQQNVIN